MQDDKYKHQRQDDLQFLKGIIQRGHTRSVYEGSRLLTIIDIYPVEAWYLCTELNSEIYSYIDERIEGRISRIDASLN